MAATSTWVVRVMRMMNDKYHSQRRLGRCRVPVFQLLFEIEIHSSVAPK
jgi:hypothetical protein